MTSTAIKKPILSEEDHKIPTFKKLPPIQNPQKMPNRKLMSPNSVSVDFNAPTVQSKQTLGGKIPVRKESADSTKPDTFKSTANQKAANKKTTVLGSGSKSSVRLNGEVAIDQSNSGIELIGYKLTNGQPATSTRKMPLPQQASDWTPLSTELPPCRICGDKASGLHYGVNTCEACKAFFRRTLKKSTINFQCTCTPEEKALGIDEPRKTTCPKCRYERCIKTGMSKDAIKIGRYTISRKRQNDREVKTLKNEKKVGVRRPSESSKSTSSSSPYSQSVSSPEELSSDITSLSLQEKKMISSAKKRRHDEEDGLLYQSLTNSILMSLMENNKLQGTAALADPNLSPVEKLLTKDTNSKSDTNTSPVEQLFASNDTNNNSSGSYPNVNSPSIDHFVSLNDEEEAFSPLAHILETYDHLMDEISPIENLFTQPIVSNPVPATSVVHTDNGNQNFLNQNGINGHSSDIVHDSVRDEALTTALFGIYDGNEINSKNHGSEQLHDSNLAEESPIENLLKAPMKLVPDSTALPDAENNSHSSVTYNPDMGLHINGNLPENNLIHDEMSQNLQVHENGLSHINVENVSTDVNGEMFLASQVDNMNGNVDASNLECRNTNFSGKDVSTEYQTESPEDLLIQEQELSRLENPAVRVGDNLGVREATQLIFKLGAAAGVLFESSKKMTCEEIKKRHAAYLEQYITKIQVFGNMSNISKEEYLEFYKQTGIDIDNRQEILIEALKYMEVSIGKLVKFAKAIPGFSELDIDDQVNLVKAARFEFWMIVLPGTMGCRKSGYQVATAPWDKEYHIEELGKLYPLDYLDQKVTIMNEFQDIKLSAEESILIKSIVLTFPDRCELKEPEKVEFLHNRLIACFLFLLANRPPNKMITVQSVMATLFKIRHLAAWDTQIIQEMFEVWPVTSNHQLVKEFVS